MPIHAGDQEQGPLEMSRTPKNVALHSIGCRTNQQEILALEAALRRHGYHVVARPDDADCVIVNTCCVTSVAESKTRRAIKSLARKAPRARLLVTGCLAQHAPQSLAALERVDWVVANGRKDDIPAILAGPPALVCAPLTQEPSPGACPADAHYRATARTRFFVKIQEGCSHRCAYCIVPSVRGPSRSVPSDAIMRSCEDAVQAGIREIVLTGTHIGQYTDGGSDLVRLIRRLLGTVGDCRIRLSSLDPRELSDELLSLLTHNPRVCEHLHLSVQSLAPAVLDAMGRGGGAADALVARLAETRARVPNLALGGDFIVGFPTESIADFERTCDAVRAAGFTHGHVFRFSKRPGTPAAVLADQVGGDERKRRGTHLMGLLDELHGGFVRSRHGTVQQVLVESTKPSQGLSANYLRVGLQDTDIGANELVRVRIVDPVAAGRLDCWASLVDGRGRGSV
ncbi:MAG: tRNA (N(6)-L-threonylcarbamoyladenosine(37)-C(2))-methylthiotransferase MtaB [Chitinivibrionales bacterium]|nr:tRNA (N(6)-L-threonylcarbamoyladenosine(37)-C(2))-methylthiotransferase MtaB [Chitinivibrionales bacterium]